VDVQDTVSIFQFLNPVLTLVEHNHPAVDPRFGLLDSELIGFLFLLQCAFGLFQVHFSLSDDGRRFVNRFVEDDPGSFHIFAGIDDLVTVVAQVQIGVHAGILILVEGLFQFFPGLYQNLLHGFMVERCHIIPLLHDGSLLHNIRNLDFINPDIPAAQLLRNRYFFRILSFQGSARVNQHLKRPFLRFCGDRRFCLFGAGQENRDNCYGCNGN